MKRKLFLIIGKCSDWPINVFIFQQSCMWPSVREHQSVHTKITIMNLFTMISTVVVDASSVRSLPVQDGMIAPFPDKSAAHELMFME